MVVHLANCTLGWILGFHRSLHDPSSLLAKHDRIDNPLCQEIRGCSPQSWSICEIGRMDASRLDRFPTFDYWSIPRRPGCREPKQLDDIRQYPLCAIYLYNRPLAREVGGPAHRVPISPGLIRGQIEGTKVQLEDSGHIVYQFSRYTRSKRYICRFCLFENKRRQIA